MNSPCVNCGADFRVCIECDWYNGVWISKDEYEARLKADLEAILVELQLEIEELDTPNNGSAYMDCVEIIQQKINALKGQQDGNE